MTLDEAVQKISDSIDENLSHPDRPLITRQYCEEMFLEFGFPGAQIPEMHATLNALINKEFKEAMEATRKKFELRASNRPQNGT